MKLPFDESYYCIVMNDCYILKMVLASPLHCLKPSVFSIKNVYLYSPVKVPSPLAAAVEENLVLRSSLVLFHVVMVE